MKDAATAALERAAARAAARARRDAVAADRRRGDSLAIVHQLQTSPRWQAARCIAGYWPQGSEVDPRPAYAEALRRGAIVALPRVLGRGVMEFVDWHGRTEELRPGRYGILEPSASGRRPGTDFDLMLLPLVACDRHGTRLGSGAGYYDRYLAGLTRRPFLLGLAFEVQVVAALPAEPWDVRLDALLTERGWFSVEAGS